MGVDEIHDPLSLAEIVQPPQQFGIGKADQRASPEFLQPAGQQMAAIIDRLHRVPGLPQHLRQLRDAVGRGEQPAGG